MKILYSRKDERLEIEISDDADWQLFKRVADAILNKFRGKLVERLDGLDERYWDLEIGDSLVTLHLQHYLGIALFAASKEANDLIQQIGEYLETVDIRSN